ncbi:hypothetical protein GLE_4168 [Lysobacter enzymogenes]|uniref:DUF1444 family protein n=1 Tax=Lysobacter enzymogenes TaxID=69 RepID=A0A0S2DLJ4_LYSEN|nr:hypothetical protein GLE_4168 [Lysobacter enzymogenes]
MPMSLLSKLFRGRRPARADAGVCPAPLDLHAFTERYAQALRALWPQARLRVGHGARLADTRIDWSLPDGFAATQFVASGYRRYLDAPEALERVLAEQVEAARALQRRHALGAQAGDDDAILPVLKTRGWHEVALQQARAIGGGAGIAFVVEALAGDLVLSFVEDRADSMDYLSPSEAERRGLAPDALRARALRNLQRFLPELEIEGGDGRYVLRLDRNYDASMALLFEHWRERAPVRGEPVFAIAARDELWLCGRDDDEGVQRLGEAAAEISRTSAYGLSSALFVWRDGALRVLED